MLRLTYSAAFLTLVFAGCSTNDHNNNSPDAGVVVDAPTAGVCGDGVVDGNEQCDDGNTVSNDGCSSTCAVQSGYTCAGTPSVCRPEFVREDDVCQAEREHPLGAGQHSGVIGQHGAA